MNTREVKALDWHLTAHNTKSGAGAFKKRLRAHYNRREGARNMRQVALTWVDRAEPVTRPESALRPFQRRITWRLDDTLRIAMREVGLE